MNEKTTMDDASFAKGMYVTLWPKVEKCHNYVSVLLAAQEQLQETVEQLIAGLKEAEQAEGHSLIEYADRLRNFPGRVEKLQKKLELIDARLASMKESRNRVAASTAAAKVQIDPMAAYASPLF